MTTNNVRAEKLRTRLSLTMRLPDGYLIKVAESQSELAAAFSILHDAYVEAGFMTPMESRMRLNVYQALPTTTTVIAVANGKVVATMSAVADSSFGLPIDHIYDLTKVRAEHRRIVEISGLAVHTDHRTDHGRLLFAMVKYMYHYTERWLHSDYAVIAVNPRHQNYYEHILLFHQLVGEVVESYDFANDAPAVCLATDLTNYRERFQEVYAEAPVERNLYNFICDDSDPGFLYPNRETHLAFDPVMTPEMLKFFFLAKSNLLTALSQVKFRDFRSMYLLPSFGKLFAEIGRKTTPLDRREHQRFPVRIQPKSLAGSGVNHIHPDIEIVSISEGGLGLYSKSPLTDGTYELHIDVDQVSPVRITVELRGHHGNYYGFALSEHNEQWTRFVTATQATMEKKLTGIAA